MQCMKTGIKFQISPIESTYHGDMYYCKDLNCFLIQGLALSESNQKPHIILTCNPPYIDTFTIMELDVSFLAWWQEWNPSVQLTGIPIIIADSRF